MKLLIPLLLAGFVITACAPMNVATEVMVEENSEEIKVQTAEPMLEATAEVMPDEALELPTWLTSELVNIKTGETFKLTDFAGKVVLVENLAMWCSSCLKQQEQVKLLHEQLGEDSGLISIGFDVDQNEEAEDLKKYVESNGFDWIYTIPSLEIVREIANLYGANFLNPPLTPILIIDRQGVVHPMNMGLKSAEDLKLFIEPFLSEGM
ncbi:MAG: redoxin domain-containing protein [Anaerolineae bacterium]|jgi:thiol-disulfide isomerase/thioredoxin|nr:redoxin domain-containing protein [Anaerolineae bacterium]